VRRLILVRHAESVMNAAGRIQGGQCQGLSDDGHAQSRHVGTALAEAYPQPRVVMSDLLRCQQTAGPLVAALGRDPQTDPRLRERRFGDWEGLTRAEVEDRDPLRWQRWRERDDTVLGEIGGETDAAFRDRIVPALREVLADTPDDGVTVAVTHGGPVWYGTHALLGLAPGTLGLVHNASVTELRSWDGERVVLERWNEIAHLPLDLRVGWRPSAVA